MNQNRRRLYSAALAVSILGLAASTVRAGGPGETIALIKAYFRTPVDFIGVSTTPPVSDAGTARLYFDAASEKLKASENGGAYAYVLQAASPTLSLQSAYDGGRTINATPGPVVMTGDGLQIPSLYFGGLTSSFAKLAGSGTTVSVMKGDGTSGGSLAVPSGTVSADGFTSPSGTTGTALSVAPGSGSTGAGGMLNLGGGSSTSGAGGAVSLAGGASVSGSGGTITLTGGDLVTTGIAGAATLRGGNSKGIGNAGAGVTIATGLSGDAATAGGTVVVKTARAGSGTSLTTHTTFNADGTLSTGTISAGTWQGSTIASTYLDAESTLLDRISSTRGTILYRGASGWAALAPSTNGYALVTHSTGADPTWAMAGGAGADTTAFHQNGDSFGATATLGSNDNFDVVIERNNTPIATFGAATTTFTGAVSATAGSFNGVLTVDAPSTAQGSFKYLVDAYDLTSAAAGTGTGIRFVGYTNGTTNFVALGGVDSVREVATANNGQGALRLWTANSVNVLTEGARLTSAQVFLVGGTTAVNATGIEAISTTYTELTSTAYGAGVFPLISTRYARGTATAPTAVQSGDQLGRMDFSGRTNSSWVGGVVGMSATAAQTWTTTALGSNLAFFTTAIGSSTPTTQLSIASTGAATFTAGITATTGGFSGNITGGNNGVIAVSVMYPAIQTSSSARFTFDSADYTSMASGVGGGIRFLGYTTAQSTLTDFAAISGTKENGTAGSLSGQAIIYTRPSSGNLTAALTLSSTGAGTLLGGLTATTGTFSGALSATTGTFTGNVDTNNGTSTVARLYAAVQADGASYTLHSLNTSAQGAGVGAGIAFAGRTSAGSGVAEANFAILMGAKEDGIAGNSKGVFQIWTDSGSAKVKQLSIASTGIATFTAGIVGTTGTYSGAVSMTALTATTGTFSGNVLPNADNTLNLGDATHRWALVRGTVITSGDLRFENGWTFTEAENHYHDENHHGLVLRRPDGTIAQEWQ